MGVVNTCAHCLVMYPDMRAVNSSKRIALCVVFDVGEILSLSIGAMACESLEMEGHAVSLRGGQQH